MNQSQKRVFAIMGKNGPNKLDSYFGAIVSENGTNCPSSVGKGSIGTGRFISKVNEKCLLYNSSVPLGSRGKATTPRMCLVGSVSAGIDRVPVICLPCLSCQTI